MGEEKGVYPYGGVLLSSEPVPQYMCIKLPKADNNDWAHKNDVNTLSWHMVDASFHTSAS